MQRYLMGFVLSALLLFFSPLAAAASGAGAVVLKINSPRVQVDGVFHDLPAAPRVIDGSTVVPLRFLVEVFGARAGWESETKEITVQNGNTVIRLRPGRGTAYIDGNEKAVGAAPVVEKGTTLVPLRFLVENLNYKVKFLPELKEIHIKRLPPPPPPNQKPVAEFSVQKSTVARGETVIYRDTSYDPDGDELVERKWTGKERAFFAPGEYEVSLQVKDSHGAWSEPYTKVIKVTGEVRMNSFEYNLNYPIPGEPLDITNIPVLELKEVDPAVTMNRKKVMISNSPEIVREDGILYSDVLEGEHRLYYHHINGSKETKNIYLLAVNQGKEPVKLTVQKYGTAGPASPMAVGRAAAYRYLDFTPFESRFLELQPGEKAILNKGMSNIAPPGKAVHGIFDINAREELLFAVVAVESKDSLAGYEELPVLPRDDSHIRGTFSRGNRFLSVYLQDDEPARLVVADGEDDSFLYGKDVWLVRKNKGNYGLTYRIKIKSKYRVGVLFSARGGVFAGAGAWGGEAFYLPNQGVLKPKEGCMIGVVEPGKEKVLEFIPPAGSYLPVNLIFIPF